MTDNKQDRSQDEGQQGIDRETEQRNRENETGQQGQSANGDTSLQDKQAQSGGQSSSGAAAFGQSGGQGGSTFVGSQGDQSSDYLTKGEEKQDFASDGQGAQDKNAGTADIETGQSQQSSDSKLDDGPDSNR